MFSKKDALLPDLVISIDQAVLDRTVSGEFRQFAVEALEERSGTVTVDCSLVSFIDSSGVGALLHLNNLLPEERRPVVLQGVSPEVMTLLELLRVSHLFKLESKA